MVATSDAVARARYVSLLTTAAMVAFAANSVLCRAALGGGEIDAASFSAIRLFVGSAGPRGYGEVFRVLRPGGCFAAYEYCLTHRFDPDNARHRKIKTNLEVGGALPDIAYPHQVAAALRQVGFELLEARDLSENPGPGIPWYQPLVGSRSSLAGFRSSQAGRMGDAVRPCAVPRARREAATPVCSKRAFAIRFPAIRSGRFPATRTRRRRSRSAR